MHITITLHYLLQLGGVYPSFLAMSQNRDNPNVFSIVRGWVATLIRWSPDVDNYVIVAIIGDFGEDRTPHPLSIGRCYYQYLTSHRSILGGPTSEEQVV